jgi:hypothetical protein
VRMADRHSSKTCFRLKLLENKSSSLIVKPNTTHVSPPPDANQNQAKRKTKEQIYTLFSIYIEKEKPLLRIGQRRIRYKSNILVKY